jgi:hypothetical protein
MEKPQEIEQLSDDEIQAKKQPPPPDPNDKRYKPNREPRQQSEKQKEAWKIALAKRKENNELRKQIKEEEEKRIQKLIEDKIVKKAISLKKQQIKKEILLDKIEDDDTPLEEIKRIIKAPPIRKPNKKLLLPKRDDELKPTAPPKPQYIFV